MDYECTQAIPLSDYEEETDDGRTDDKTPVGQLLVNCQKGFPETIFPLYEGDNVIGRQQDKVNIYIPLKAISKQHACIEIRDREVHFIYDMESRNKTRRGKMFLTPKVRYELKDGDTLLFGDVTTVYKKVVETKPDDAGSETGSETGSESMLINVSGIDSQNNSVGAPPNYQSTDDDSRVRVEESFHDDDDAASDASVDLLAATEAYAAGSDRVTVEETPITSRTKTRTIRNDSDITVPESPLDADATKPILRVSASGDDSYVFDAPTQAYRDPDEENAVPDPIFDCPTQAYGNDDDDVTDNEAGIDLDGPTQAYPGGASPVFDRPTQAYGDQDEEGPTQAYALEKETIEPTIAYSMDSVKVTKEKSKSIKVTRQESGGFALEKTDVGDSEFDPSILEGPTQAYPDPDAGRPTLQAEEDSPAYSFLGSTFVSPQGGKVSATVSSSASTASPSSQPTQLLRKDSEGPTQILPQTNAADAPTQILSSPKHTKCDIPDTLIISSPEHNKGELPDTVLMSSPEQPSEKKLHDGKKGKWPPRAGSSEDREAATQVIDPSPSPPKRKTKKVSIFSDQPTQVYGEDTNEGDGGGGFDDEPTQKYDDVEATQAYGDEAETQAYGDEGEGETQPYGNVEEAETQAYGDEVATQAYGDNVETQAYGDPEEEAETQAYGTDECGISLEEMQTLAYGDGGGDANDMETQAYGDNANEMETQAYGDNANEMETQACGDNANEMETQAYGNDVDDEGETQAYGLEVVPDSEETDDVKTETKKYEDFPESMEDIFEDDLKRKSHVFLKPLDYSDDDDETPPTTEALDDELPDLDADAPVVEQELDVPPDVDLENEANDIVDEHEIEEKKDVESFAEKSKDGMEGQASEGSSRRKGRGKKTDKQKSLEKPEAADCNDTDVIVKVTEVVVKETNGKATATEKDSGSGRGGRGRRGRNVSEDGPVLLDAREFGLKDEQKPLPEADAEAVPAQSGGGKANSDIVDEPKSKRGRFKKVVDEEESEVPLSTGRSKRGKTKEQPEKASTEPKNPVRKTTEEEVVEETVTKAAKSKKMVDTEDSSEPVVPKSKSRRGASQVNQCSQPDASTSGDVADEAGEEVAEPAVRGRGRRRTGKKQDDDANSVASETVETESSGKTGRNRRGKEPTPVVAASKVTRGAMSRRSLPAADVEPRGTPKRGRRSVAFTGLEDDRESVTSEVSEKDVPSTKAGRKGRGKAALKLSLENDDAEEDRASVASEVSEKDVPSTKAGRKGRGKAASKLSPEKEEMVDTVSEDAAETGKGKRNRRMSKKMSETVDTVAESVSTAAIKGRRQTKKDGADVTDSKQTKGKQTKTEGADVSESKQTREEEPAAEESVKSIQGKRGMENSKEEACEASTTKRAKRGAKKQEDKVEEEKVADEEEESHTATASKRSKRGANKKENIVEEENIEPETETTMSSRGRRASKKTEQTKEEVRGEPETVRRESRRQSDVQVPDIVVNKRGREKVAAEDEDDTRSTSSSRGKEEEEKPVLPGPRGRGRRSHQPPAEDDETDSMSTISEASEVSTASSARGRRTKTKAVEESPATTPKGVRGRTTSNESKEPAATPPRGRTPAATPTRGRGANAAVERLTSPRLQNLPGEQPHRVLFTGVVDDKGQKVVKELGGELVTGTDKCTHLVTDRVRRTVKFLCCLGRGVPIISTDWLDRCAAAKRFVDHTPFIVKDPENEKKFGFKLLTSLQKADAHKLFTDYKIHVTKNVKPDPPSMKQIIMSAEGKYVASMPKKGDEHTVIVSCDEDRQLCQAALDAGVHVVSNEFILTGLLQQSIDSEKYSLFTSEQASGSTAKKRPAQGTSGDSAKKRRR